MCSTNCSQGLVLICTSTPILKILLGPSRICVSPCASECMHFDDRLKEKNREAQKKYRERQKGKLQESECKVSELMEQINALRVEKVCIRPAG